MKILIVEDETKLASSIHDFLKKEENMQCDLACTYREGLKKIQNFEYDCIILDISLPDGNGLDILSYLKENRVNAGVLIISARNSTEYKIEGLNLGVDDYIAKPFHLAELNARINSILRRRNLNGETVLNMNEIKVYPARRQVFVKNDLLVLTPKEYDLFMYFVSNKNRVITKESLIDHFWDNDMDRLGSNDLVYAHIKNLRQKMNVSGSKEYIQTVYGIGYKFSLQQ